MKAKIWLALTKLNSPADLPRLSTPPIALPSRLAPIFSQQNLLGETIAWAVPCISGRGRRIPPNLFGALVATEEEPRKIVFVAKKSGRGFCQTIDLDGSTVARQPPFLSENLVIFPTAGHGPKYSFVFARSRGAMVEQIVEYLRARESKSAPASGAAPVKKEEAVIL